MVLDLYFLIGLIAFMVHNIINFDVLFGSDYKSNYVNIKPYRRFLFSISIFFLIDTIWGFAKWQKLAGTLYISTVLYNLCLAYVILCWMS